ncbi:MAG TPA: YcxB family protein [Herpetosiphonaceae bacterium]
MAEEQAMASEPAPEDPPAPIEAKVTPQAGDYQYFQLWDFFHSPVGIGFSVIAGGYAALTVYGIIVARGVPSLSIFWPLLLFLLLVASIALGARRAFATTPLLREPKTYLVDAEGLALESRSLSVRSAWRELSKVAESNKAFFFYIARGQAHILPKRALADPADAARLRELARAHGPRKRR